jgi:hypothetical protein
VKLIVTIAAFFTSFASHAADAESWLRQWPKGSTIDSQVSANLVVEVPHSLFDYAQRLLQDSSILAIGNSSLPGFRYSCPTGTAAYLVRALYEHPTNGIFEVYRFGDALLVRHYALGSQAPLHRSALVVCLSVQPKEVYVATGGAM